MAPKKVMKKVVQKVEAPTAEPGKRKRQVCESPSLPKKEMPNFPTTTRNVRSTLSCNLRTSVRSARVSREPTLLGRALTPLHHRSTSFVSVSVSVSIGGAGQQEGSLEG